MRLVQRVGVFFFFFLDEDGAERERDVVHVESQRPEKRDRAGRRGRSKSESELESSYFEWDEEGEPFVRRNSVKYCVKVVTIAPWVNFGCMVGSLERPSSQEIRKILYECVNTQINLSNSEDMLRVDLLFSKKACTPIKSM